VAAKIIFLIIIFLLILVYSGNVVLASSINLSESGPDTITDAENEFSVKVNLTIDAADETSYYLRGVFYKKDTDRNGYCGFTWNGNTWFKGPYSSDQGWKNFLKVIVASKSASITLKAKIDNSDSDCNDNGTYHFKVQRFTENSSSGTFDDQNEQTITVMVPTNSPTPKPVPSATKIPTNVPTLKPSATPKSQVMDSSSSDPISTEQVLAENILTDSDTSGEQPEEEVSSDSGNNNGKILGTEDKISEIPKEPENGKSAGPNFWIIGILLMGGSLSLGSAVVYSLKKRKDV
jgi:hypothetical protein